VALKKKTTKAKATKAKEAKEPDYKAAYYFLVIQLRWRGKCKELIAESEKRL